MSCPDEGTIARFLEGALHGAALAALEDHVDACSTCRLLLVALAQGKEERGAGFAQNDTEATPEGGVGAGTPAARLREGDRLGRYVVLELLGAGGMGVVYAASDPELDRKVAIKVLRPAAARDVDSDEAQARLLREARAMAALSHPNVVAVYDVGTFGARVFVAMELVDGVTLTAWLRERRRSWREVLRAFLEAGRGLAAAHAAGIVHRDFKPDNVLVGRDGRVRVTDFGLARPAGTVGASEPPSPAAQSPTASWHRLTETGTVLGTPRFMAPEQLEGIPADARTDQFSFAVALYEALCGEYPFASTSTEDRLRAIERGPPPYARRRGIPRGVLRALGRALSRVPEERFANFDDLLAVLGRAAGALRRRLVAAGLVAFLVGTGVAIWSASAREDPCAGVERALDGAWSAEGRGRMATAIDSLRLSHGPAMRREIEKEVDRYATQWLDMSRAACEATKTRGEQSQEMFDRRTICLDHRRRALALVVQRLGTLDARGLPLALSVVRALPRLSDCGELRYLAAGTTAREDPEEARASEQLVLAQLQYVAGKDAEAIDLARRAALVFRQRGNTAREAEALVILGKAEGFVDVAAALKSLARAAELAGKVGVTPVRIDAFGQLANAYMRAGRMNEARGALDLAFAALRGAPDPQREADLRMVRGVYFGRGGKFLDAHRELAQALSLLTSLLGPDSQYLHSAHSNLSIALKRLGRLDDALHHARRSLELNLRLGEENPVAAQARDDVAQVLVALGRYREARSELERARVVLRKAYGERHLGLAHVEQSLATVLAELSEWDEAIAHARAAVAILEASGTDHIKRPGFHATLGSCLSRVGKTDEAERILRDSLTAATRILGGEHQSVAEILRSLGQTALEAGRNDEAFELETRALRILRKSLGDDHAEVGLLLADMAAVERARRRWRGALELDQRALAIYEKVLPAAHPHRSHALIALASDHLGLGAPARAQPLVQEAHVYFAERQDEWNTARAAFVLARATLAAGGDRTVAIELAERARTVMARKGRPRDVAPIDRFICREAPPSPPHAACGR